MISVLLALALAIPALAPVLPPARAVPRTEPAKDAAEPTFAEYDKAVAVIRAFNEGLKKRNLPPMDMAGLGGRPGPAGPAGPPGRAPTADEIYAAVVRYFAEHPPTPPIPTDKLADDLRAACAAETPADRAKLPALLGVYDAYLDKIADKTMLDTAQLEAEMLKGRRAAVTDAELRKVRAVVNAGLMVVINAGPMDPSRPLTDDLRAKMRDYYVRVVKILETIK